MPRVEKSIIINASPDRVFAFIDDPENSPQWSPGLVEVKEITWQEVGKRFQWTYKMAGFLLHGEMTDIEHVPNERIVSQSKGGAVSTWTWTLEPHDGGTRLSVVVEYTIPIPVLGRIAEVLVLRQNERDTELSLVNIKDRMEV